MLQRMAEVGMMLIEVIGERAEALAEAGPEAVDQKAGALAQIYARVTRALRMTMTLERRFAEGPLTPMAAHPANDRAEAAAESRAMGERVVVRLRRTLVGALVDNAIEAEAGEDEREDLRAALCERLDEAEREGDFACLTIAEVVDLIRKDLGLPPDPHPWRDAYGPPFFNRALEKRDDPAPPLRRSG